jgi:hypothetical protein
MNHKLNNFKAYTENCEVFPYTSKQLVAFSILKTDRSTTVYNNILSDHNCHCCAARMHIIKNIAGSDGPIYQNEQILGINNNWEQLYSKFRENSKPPYKLLVNKPNSNSKNNIYFQVQNSRKHHFCEPFYETSNLLDHNKVQQIFNKYVGLYWDIIKKLVDKGEIISKIKSIFVSYKLNYSEKIINAIDWFTENIISKNIRDMTILDFYEYLGRLIISEKIINIGIDDFEPYIQNFFVLNHYIKKLVKNYSNDEILFDQIINTDFSMSTKIKNPNSQKFVKLAINKLKDLNIAVHSVQELESLGAHKIKGKNIQNVLDSMLNANKEYKNRKILTLDDLIENINNNKIYKLKVKTDNSNIIYTASHNNRESIFNVPHLWSFLYDDTLADNRVYEITHIYKYKDEGYNFCMFRTKNNLIKNFQNCLHPEFLNIKWQNKFSKIFDKLNIICKPDIPEDNNISSGIGVSIDKNIINTIEIQINDSKKWLTILIR